MSTTEAWAVVAYDWQYNDENYYQPDGSPYYHASENGAGVFLNEDDARAVARRLNATRVAECLGELFEEYGSDWRYDWEYDDVVDMGWAGWRDWLADHQIEPPEAADNEPTVEELAAWVQRFQGAWTPKQRRLVAEYLVPGFFYTVEKVILRAGPEEVKGALAGEG